jgi:hypothetical protein
MEPQLISRKAIKKILKKKYFSSEDNYLNKFFNSFVDTVKINWLPIVIILISIALLIQLFIENKNKKALQEQYEEFERIQKNKERFEDYDDFKSKPNYESEYYKMLPRVTNNPDVIPYQY